MIKIETKVIVKEEDNNNVSYAIGVDYEESDNVARGEYLAILERVKQEVLVRDIMSEEELKDFLFKGE